MHVQAVEQPAKPGGDARFPLMGGKVAQVADLGRSERRDKTTCAGLMAWYFALFAVISKAWGTDSKPFARMRDRGFQAYPPRGDEADRVFEMSQAC